MKKYLQTLIEEKGKSLETEINIDGHFGLTYGILVEFICQPSMKQFHAEIRRTLVMIDYKNGDVFHYLQHLAKGMIEATGLDAFIGGRYSQR